MIFTQKYPGYIVFHNHRNKICEKPLRRELCDFDSPFFKNHRSGKRIPPRITTFMLGSSCTELMICLGVSVSMPSKFSTHCLFHNFLNTSIFELRNQKKKEQKSRPVLHTIGRYFQAHIDIPHSPANNGKREV